MNLKEKISKDYMDAFRAKDTVSKNLLSVIKGEIQTIEKNTGVDCLSNDDVTAILNKTAKSLKENVTKFDDEESRLQLIIVESYLPKQLTRDEIVTKITDLKNSGVSNIGAIMKEFAQLAVDRKVVSEVIKEIIQ